MEMSSFKDALDLVAKKQRLYYSKAQEVIDQVGQEIKQALKKMQSVQVHASPVDQKSILTKLKIKLKEVSPPNQLLGSQKELSVELIKYVKLLKNSFDPDISKAYRYVDFDIHTVNQIIASHFYRQGLFDLGDCFINEARESEEAFILKSTFQNMYQILEAIRSMNLEPALNWAAANRDRLMQNGSSLELKFHQLQFVEILKEEGRNDALKYAKTYFAPLASQHMAIIEKLMGCLLWAGRLNSSPYAELVSEIQWEKLAEEVTQQFCILLGQSYESPLSVVVAAGIQGLPTLLKLANVMAENQEEWQAMKQLPVTVELGWELQFHSIFVCPISSEEGSEVDTPVMMPCGHVFCNRTIIKILENSPVVFRCPSCRRFTGEAECRRLYF